ncbi:MAG: NAD(P)-dependent oxidoreductase [Rhodospirillales bacterium CG15_BIG_FIL_POST_REV_8_21_14_020_66_15]|nr:MAG: NAD(P)-dependent oxidoreductase [Rhodospirillales bacterium CG15_BIG_FIL_POST_REV_8_21_14_020_66_15]
MSDKVTIVTGGSRGIGRATALLAAKAGHAVCINYASDQDAADSVCAGIIAHGGKALAVPADTSSQADVIRLFETVDRELGPVTGLVNNAGIHGPRGPVKDLTEADIRRVLEVNVLGLFLCAQQAIKRMSTDNGGAGGAIVNISSGAAVIGSPGGGVLYAASKGAVNSFSTGLAQEVIGQGIRVNTVAPGLTETDMTRATLEKRAKATPMGRAGRPEEIAQAIVFLLSDEASYIACANLRVSGGKP